MFGRKKNNKKQNTAANRPRKGSEPLSFMGGSTGSHTNAGRSGGSYYNRSTYNRAGGYGTGFGSTGRGGYGTSFGSAGRGGYGTSFGSAGRGGYGTSFGSSGSYGYGGARRGVASGYSGVGSQQSGDAAKTKRSNGLFGSRNRVKVPFNRNKSAIFIYSIIFILIFAYIIGYTISMFSKKEVQYDVVDYGTIETPNTIQGVIIRDEKVYNTSAAGVVEYEATDGEKVKQGAVVCNIMNAEEVAKMEAELSDINESIMKIQNERGDMSIYSEDVKRANSQIKAVIDDAAGDFTELEINKVYDLRNNIENKMDERNQLLLSESQGDLTDLVTQRKAQLSKLDNSISKMTAEAGGIVSYCIDGKEGEYTLAAMPKLTEKQTQTLANVSGDYKHSVKAGDAVFKIINSNDWYIAAYVDAESISDWEQGDVRSVYVKNSAGETQKLSATVNTITAGANDNQKYITLKLTRDMLDFMDLRSVTFELASYERGFKIPNSAIVDETTVKIPSNYIDENNQVIKVEKNAEGKDVETTVAVSVADTDEENGVSFVPIQLGVLNVDTVIKNPDTGETFTIAETDTRKGIYVVNSGMAEFKVINMEGASSNSTHTVLDDSKNTNIYVYDRIMTNTDGVQKEQRVYN